MTALLQVLVVLVVLVVDLQLVAGLTFKGDVAVGVLRL